MKREIALAIVTKNRNKELERCLDSINIQSHKPDKVIIIDNDPQGLAQKIVSQKKYKDLYFSYHTANGSVPKCRNLAMEVAKTKYLGFTDDDCVLDRNWLKTGLKTIKSSKKSYVLGKTMLLNPNNIFAMSQYSRDDYWKDHNPATFDTKNVILNLDLINFHKLQFDEQCQQEAYDSADFDFDFILRKAGLQGKSCLKMILFHQETNTFQRFKRRAYFRGYLAKYLNKKWQLHDGLIDLSTNSYLIWLLKLLKNYCRDYQRYSKHMLASSFFKKSLAILLIKLFERYYVLGYVANQKDI